MIDILVGDCLETLRTLPDASVQCCVTSPPYYGLRDYGHAGQIGLEETPDAYVSRLVKVFREVRRCLRDDGTLWLNLGDSYASGGGLKDAHRNNSGGFGGATGERTQGYAKAGGGFRKPSTIGGEAKAKDLLMIPATVALALRADGWFLRSDIIWQKPNPMPESVTDRPTSAHEHVFLLTKGPRYFYDALAIHEPATNEAPGNTRAVRSVEHQRESGENANLRGSLPKIGARQTRNARNVWTITPKPFVGAHFATMPPDLVERCLKAGSKAGDTVLDPFGGAGTTAMVAEREGRNAVLCELKPAYVRIAKRRLGLPLTLAERLAELDAAMTELHAAMEAA